MEGEKNNKKLKKQKKALQNKENEYLLDALQVDEAKLKSLVKKLKKVDGYPERGIETWYRLASKNLYTRRQIVDTKSNILITINAIMISALIGTMYPLLAGDPHYIYGMGPIVVGNLISIAFATLATRPVLGKGIFTKDRVVKRKALLMTFDDFYKMPVEEYETALDELMKDRDFLYGSIKRDLHRLGVDLSSRYKNIRIAYNVFLIGLILGVAGFTTCHIFYH